MGPRRDRACRRATVEAFEAIVATLRLGSVGYEPQLNAKGERMIWIENHWPSKLCAMRRPGENYSDVILRIVEMEAGKRSACVLPLGRLFHFFKTLFGVFQLFFQVCDIILKRLGFLTPAWPPPRRSPEAAGERPKRMSPRSIFVFPKAPSRAHGHDQSLRFLVSQPLNG